MQQGRAEMTFVMDDLLPALKPMTEFRNFYKLLDHIPLFTPRLQWNIRNCFDYLMDKEHNLFILQ